MSKLTHHDLQQFTGDLMRYQYPLNKRVIYTPGVKFVADQGGAYLLIDEIALSFGTAEMRRAMARDPRLETLQFWRLDVNNDRSARLTARADSGVESFINRRIPYTDFPMEYVDIWAGHDGRYWTLYLPSEH